MAIVSPLHEKITELKVQVANLEVALEQKSDRVFELMRENDSLKSQFKALKETL